MSKVRKSKIEEEEATVLKGGFSTRGGKGASLDGQEGKLFKKASTMAIYS